MVSVRSVCIADEAMQVWQGRPLSQVITGRGIWRNTEHNSLLLLSWARNTMIML